MRALVYTKESGLSIRDYPNIGSPPPGYVKMSIAYVGICGTDFHIVHGTHPAKPTQIIPGHEVSATVLKIGDGVIGFNVGMPVIVNPYLSCGKCALCRRGRTNCCTSLKVIGVHTDGALCEQIIMPAKNVYSARGLDMKSAAMVEVLAVGVHAVRRAQLTKDGRVLVLGAGPVGLCISFLLRDAKFNLTLVDISEERVRMAKERFGFTSVIQADSSKLNAKEVSGGFDFIFDVTGYAASVEHTFNNFLTYGGTMVSVGIMNDKASINLADGHKHEKSLIFTRNSTDEDFEQAITFALEMNGQLARLVSKVSDLNNVVTNIGNWADNKSGLLKGVVQI